TFRLALPKDITKRNVHNAFHSSLLRIHVPSDDRLFPGRLSSEFGFSGEDEPEWRILSIDSHKGVGKRAAFEVVWSTGDRTWLSFPEVDGLPALLDYLELLGI
ncbi:hypothetical protein CYLTODRAFT_320795, partial [Cylindrobasidium torrendii FP15055 ss-10]